MRPYIGQDVIYNNKKYHVQDIDHLQMIAKIGIPDENNIIWEHKLIEFDNLLKIENGGNNKWDKHHKDSQN